MSAIILLAGITIGIATIGLGLFRIRGRHKLLNGGNVPHSIFSVDDLQREIYR